MIAVAVLLIKGSRVHTQYCIHKTRITCFKLINFKTIPHEENVRSAFGSVTRNGAAFHLVRGAEDFSFPPLVVSCSSACCRQIRQVEVGHRAVQFA